MGRSCRALIGDTARPKAEDGSPPNASPSRMAGKALGEPGAPAEVLCGNAGVLESFGPEIELPGAVVEWPPLTTLGGYIDMFRKS
jgi:hypothetical protein